MLTTHNRFKPSAAKRIQEFPEHAEELKYLQENIQEDEIRIQQVKGITKKDVKSLVEHVVVSNFLLEDHLRVIPPRVAKIKLQLAIHEVTVRLLEPMDFKTITTEADAWKDFIGESIGPS